VKKRFFVMDPAGLAPASSGANADMLLYTITGPGPQVHYKTKKTPFSRDLFCSTRLILARYCINQISVMNVLYQIKHPCQV